MRRLTWVCLVALVIGSGATYCLSGGAAVGTAAPAPADERLFEGKILVLSYKSEGHGATLEGVACRQLGSKAFLVGKFVDVRENGAPSLWAGATLWVPVDDVSQIMEFKTVDEVRTMYKLRDEKKAEAPGQGF
jgi:hypothetical protein